MTGLETNYPAASTVPQGVVIPSCLDEKSLEASDRKNHDSDVEPEMFFVGKMPGFLPLCDC